jgi:hypothetical protein
MVIVRLNLEKKEYLIRFQIIYNSIKNEEHTVEVNTINKFENHLLSISAERQKMFHPKSHPTYNERHQKS